MISNYMICSLGFSFRYTMMTMTNGTNQMIYYLFTSVLVREQQTLEWQIP